MKVAHVLLYHKHIYIAYNTNLVVQMKWNSPLAQLLRYTRRSIYASEAVHVHCRPFLSLASLVNERVVHVA